MIEGKSVLAVIVARGGSRALPDKNIRPLAGTPLIGWTIEAAKATRTIDRLILSSDSDEIIATARALGCEAPFRRSAELASDTANSIDVVLDAADRVPDHDLVVLLQPTSPLRNAADIDGAVETLVAAGASACVSVIAAPTHPWLVYRESPPGHLVPFVQPPAGSSLRRQDLPAAWALNGAVYVASLPWLRKERTFVMTGRTVSWHMPSDRSIDIDTLADFQEAERRLSGR